MRRTDSRLAIFGALAAATALAATAAFADETTGITDKTIKIGNIMPYSGPASASLSAIRARFHSPPDEVRDLAAARKGDDEAQQIEAERQHPEQGHRDDIGGEMRRR